MRRSPLVSVLYPASYSTVVDAADKLFSVASPHGFPRMDIVRTPDARADVAQLVDAYVGSLRAVGDKKLVSPRSANAEVPEPVTSAGETTLLGGIVADEVSVDWQPAAVPIPRGVEEGARAGIYVWSLVTLALLGAAVWVLSSLGAVINPEKEYVWQSVVALVVGKLALAGLLGYGVVWTARMAQASMHEAAVNAHRALSLAGLRANVERMEESKLSEELAREAAKAIYETSETGYVKGRSGSKAESAVLEGLKGMMREVRGSSS